MSAALLAASKLEVRWGPTFALRLDHLQLPAGQTLGLIGPNGSGKTTLLRVLAGLLPAAGHLQLLGQPRAAYSLRALARLRVFLPVSGPAAVSGTVYESMALAAAATQPLLGGRASPAAVQAVLQALGLRLPLHTPLATLSAGDQQLVRLGRAMLVPAPLWLLDEPSSHLDLRRCQRLRRLLQQRQLAGQSTVLSLHDLSLAGMLCQQLLLLQGGRCVAQGTPQAVLQPALLQQVFATPLSCSNHPQTQTPLVHLGALT